jgi:predicted nicotinamide N-methyase
VVLAGDAFSDPELAARTLGFLHRAADRGARVPVVIPAGGTCPRIG